MATVKVARLTKPKDLPGGQYVVGQPPCKARTLPVGTWVRVLAISKCQTRALVTTRIGSAAVWGSTFEMFTANLDLRQ